MPAARGWAFIFSWNLTRRGWNFPAAGLALLSAPFDGKSAAADLVLQ
ncbi:MAG: hypothetical protein QHC40_12640 [Sphingobium sp.]|nr:hypothetical protein [Sphingobium sp.]